MNKLKSVYIKTIGCQMNEYDSAKMADILFKFYGAKRTDLVEDADILLLNTCSVREKASEKVFSDLGRWRSLKEQRKELIIGVGGCVASQEGANILKRAPYVDLVFGPQTLHKLPELIDQVIKEQRSLVNIAWDPIEKFDNLPEPKADGPYAYLSIMEGCNKYCSFCIVPYTRGNEVSRDLQSVLLEAASLEEQGVKEITLLGQNVNAYKSYNSAGEVIDLARLLQYISELSGIERLRFTTSHPKEFTDNLILGFKEIPKLANHLHLPIQSGSDVILNKMKRGYTALEYIEKIDKLKKIRPNISISSDFIVGFPGETDKDFQATLDIVDAIGFDNSYSFIYSKRPGTIAANYLDDIPMDVKKERLHILQEKISRSSASIAKSMLNTIQKVVVSNISNKNSNLLCARTENNRLITFEGKPDLIGKMIEVQVIESLPNSFKGILLGA